MRQGLDYNETYAPVANIVSLRAAIYIAALMDWELDAGDVSSAFLSADVDTELYVELPPELSLDPAASYKAARPAYHRLRKSCYGIPQGPYLYNRKSNQSLLDAGMLLSPHDYALYYHPNYTFTHTYTHIRTPPPHTLKQQATSNYA